MENNYYDILKSAAKKVELNGDEFVICMISEQKRVYSMVERINCDSEQDIVDKLMAILPENDRELIAIACFSYAKGISYPDGVGLDPPGYNFRSALLKINPANSNAVIYARGRDGVRELKYFLH